MRLSFYFLKVLQNASPDPKINDETQRNLRRFVVNIELPYINEKEGIQYSRVVNLPLGFVYQSLGDPFCIAQPR